MIDIKRVILHGTTARSRHGAYYRALDTETGKRSYYKIAGLRGSHTKEAARAKFAVREQKRLATLEETPKRALAPEEKKELADLEDATLHFRIDYTGDAKSGHKFQMRDSYITAQVPRGMSDPREDLRDLFKSAFNDQFGGGLSEYIEDGEETDLIEGLERGQDAPDAIRIRYNYGGDKWKIAETTPGVVKDIETQKELFFYGTLKRARK